MADEQWRKKSKPHSSVSADRAQESGAEVPAAGLPDQDPNAEFPAAEFTSESAYQQNQKNHPSSKALVRSKSSAEDREAVFRGCFEHSVDDKGRVSIPATYRQLLLENHFSTLILTNYVCDGARCIEAYTEADWRELEKRLARRSRFDPQVKRLENYYLARAVSCPIDGSGRINIPPHLRSYAGVGRDVVFAATLRGFRIWDRRVWELIFSEAEAALIEDPSIFENVDRD